MTRISELLWAEAETTDRIREALAAPVSVEIDNPLEHCMDIVETVRDGLRHEFERDEAFEAMSRQLLVVSTILNELRGRQ